MTITIRAATPADRDGVTKLHTGLSQAAYAHILPEQYLRSVMPGEKQTLWAMRLSGRPTDQRLSILVAEDGPDLAGFTCFVFDGADPWGAYLHNLYVSNAYQRQGIARRLILAGLESFPADFATAPISLRAFAANRPACLLYERLGGTIVENLTSDYPDHPPVAVTRYAWPNREALRHAVEA